MTDWKRLHHSLERARTAALKLRRGGTFWEGELELNAAPSAQFILLGALLSDGARWLTEGRARGAARYILRTLNDDGSLSPYRGRPGHRSLTLEGALALRLVDLKFGWPDEQERALAGRSLERMKHFLEESLKSASAEALFRSTEVFLGLLGLLPWERIPKLPLELLLAPERAGIELTAYWIRTVSIPMALLGSIPARTIAATLPTETETLRTEFSEFLKPETSPGFLRGALRRLGGLAGELPRVDLLRARAEDRIASFTESNGDIGGNPYAAFFCALYWDRLESPTAWQRVRKQRALDALLDYAVEDARASLLKPEWRLQTNLSTIWDTSFFCSAFESRTPELDSTMGWLSEQQIRDTRGDWCRNIAAAPAGFSFGRGHDHYPVTDCTALALLALHRHRGDDFLSDVQATTAAEFLLGFQAPDGGFAPYEKPRLSNPAWWNRRIPFQDIPTEIFDRTKADVSGKVVEALALFRRSPLQSRIEAALDQARTFLMSTREEDGTWIGNYGVRKIYGTAFSVRGLRAIDRRPKREWAAPAVDFYLKMQNPDGGWGEHEDGSRCESSTVQTAWALLGLLACTKNPARSSRAMQSIDRGLEFLVSRQQESGFWDEPRHLGMVFPGTVNFRYEFYPAYFPMMALDEALRAFSASGSSPSGPEESQIEE
jgi:squalene-hopene/tetraprenyl-beta-curcumene cyclase